METWKDIIGFEKLYQISDMGRVRVKRNGSIRRWNTCGRYAIVLLCKNGFKKQFRVHRLVAMHFIPNPKSKTEVNHKDGNKLDNRHFMLEWTTPSENMIHAYKMGRPNSGVAVFGRFGSAA